MISNIIYMVCVSFFLLLPKSWTKAEFFTAIAQMEPLLELHRGVIDVLDKYIMKEQKRIAILKAHLQFYKIEQKKAMEDIQNYLGNPINAFTLVKRLTIDLDAIDDNLKSGIAYINNITLRLKGAHYPTMEDLAGAAQALARLQATYRLRVRDLAAGVLNGAQHSHSMTAADCFELARTVFNFRDFNNTIAWSMEALQKIKKENNIGHTHTLTESDILDYVIFSHFFIGDVKGALEWTHKLLEIDPNRPRARSNIQHFEKTIRERIKQKQKKQSEDKIEKSKVELTDDLKTYKKDYYEALCRGEVEVPNEITRRLGCRYLTEHHPFLRLAPLKVEQLYINPDVYLFHQVISDGEIDFLKNISLPRDYQNMFTASEGNRIATVMFYMSEVAQGGATVFTELGLSVFPVKHAALFWMNLHPSGEGDPAMFHAGCPVLRGSKWVGNKWLHQVGQELLKPCNLDYKDERMRNIPRGTYY